MMAGGGAGAIIGYAAGMPHGQPLPGGSRWYGCPGTIPLCMWGGYAGGPAVGTGLICGREGSVWCPAAYTEDPPWPEEKMAAGAGGS